MDTESREKMLAHANGRFVKSLSTSRFSSVALACVVAAADGGCSSGAPATSTPATNVDASTSPPGGDASAIAPRGDASVSPAEGGTSATDAGAALDSAANGPSGCSKAYVCDNFEQAAAGGPPSAPWAVAATAGTVTIDTTHAYSGTHAVKVAAPDASGYQSTMLRLIGAGLPGTNHVFGRMMFWLDSAPDTSVHWTFIDGSGLVAGKNYHAVYRYGGQLPVTGADGGFVGSQMIASYDTPDSYNGVGPGSDCYQHGGGTVPVATWTCAEWEFDGPNNTMRFWSNGTADDSLAVLGTGEGCTQQDATYVWTAPRFQQIDVGWESYQPDSARTIWLDDVAIGPNRIGCPSK